MVSPAQFDKAWLALVAEGLADVRGGPRYREIFREWMRDGQPDKPLEYIRERLEVKP